jgi:hypothetical protein
VVPSPNSFEEAKGGKNRERRVVRDTDEKGYFWKFLEVLFLCRYN